MKCPLCGIEFSTQKELVSHVAFEHAESDDDDAIEEQTFEFSSWEEFEVSWSSYITCSTLVVGSEIS